MRYSIENDTLRLTVDTHGAEAVSVIHKPTGAELLWSGDPSVWGRHAPILFPYTGKLTGGKMIAKGVEYAGGQHGFARDVEHAMTRHTADTLEFELHANPETLPKWPYAFVRQRHSQRPAEWPELLSGPQHRDHPPDRRPVRQ